MKQSITREANHGLRFAGKFHPLGKMSNFMNEMTYQPQHPPTAESLDNPLSPYHRAELREAMELQGIPEPPARRLTRRDYFTVLRRPLTDPYENSPYKAEWEAHYPALAQQLKDAWDAFLAALPPPVEYTGLGWQGSDLLPPLEAQT